MKKVVGISEIVLWTADKARALSFYRDLIGLEVEFICRAPAE